MYLFIEQYCDELVECFLKSVFSSEISRVAEIIKI